MKEQHDDVLLLARSTDLKHDYIHTTGHEHKYFSAQAKQPKEIS